TTETPEAKSTETTETVETKTETKSFYSDKLKRAVHLLLFRRGKMPGAKDWELKEKLGKNYEQVLEQLNQLLAELDLEIKKVKETSTGEITPEGVPLEEARYQVILKGTLGLKEAKMIGWRVDNLAGLSASLAYLVSKQGKAPREEIEKLLA